MSWRISYRVFHVMFKTSPVWTQVAEDEDQKLPCKLAVRGNSLTPIHSQLFERALQPLACGSRTQQASRPTVEDGW